MVFLLIAMLPTQHLFAISAFPAISGLIVDKAGLLSSESEFWLAKLIKWHQAETSNQVAIVTLPDLQGATMEDYGTQLGRHWGIGQAKRDKGVLLIVVHKERKAHIEVGPGLQDELPDAVTDQIIEQRILPAFRADNFPRGIFQGVDGILSALEGTYKPESGLYKRNPRYSPFITFLMVAAIVLVFYLSAKFGGGYRGSLRGFGAPGMRSGGFGGAGGGSGGGGGGGFGGGGGSFGGGGASGGW